MLEEKTQKNRGSFTLLCTVSNLQLEKATFARKKKFPVRLKEYRTTCVRSQHYGNLEDDLKWLMLGINKGFCKSNHANSSKDAFKAYWKTGSFPWKEIVFLLVAKDNPVGEMTVLLSSSTETVRKQQLLPAREQYRQSWLEFGLWGQL